MKKWRRLATGWVCLIVCALLGEATAVSTAGTGPDAAVTPTSEWQQLKVGGEHWYAFQYAGDGSQIEIRLQAEPEDSLDFEVWTPEGIRRWRLGLESDPIGRGSADPYADGVTAWSGSFQIAGTYYVAVRHVMGGASYYLLEVQGDGVSSVPPDPSATPSPDLSQPQPAPAAPSAPSGQLVFQTAWGGPFYIIRADGAGLQRITDGMDPTWSPDGSQIAFVRWREPRGVWVINADGSGERRIFDWSEPRWTSWSPDGMQVLFARVTGGRQEPVEFCFRGVCITFPANPHWVMGVVNVQDGGFHEPPPPDTQTSRAPDWSPDGSRVVFADVHGLRVQTLDREDSYMLTADARDTSPAWSPDGRSVAFTRRQHDHWEVYVVAADGRNLARLTDTPRKPGGDVGNSAAPAWSPDGQYLAYLTDRSGRWEIWIMRANGSKQQPMFEGVLDSLTLEYAHLGERAISWTE